MGLPNPAGYGSLTGHLSLILHLASTNPGKLREFRQAGNSCGIFVEPVPDAANLPPCVEDGATFEENARKKAIYYSHHAEGLVFADDSGLCVDAMDGAPGIHSARFAGPAADDAANNLKLLRELRPFPGLQRTAHYVCVIALAERGFILAVTQGRADGVVLETPRGSGGFGYDPLFFDPPLGKTFAELSPEEKFPVSHRGEAFRKLTDWLGENYRHRGTHFL